jgi:hypothetical protein
VGIVEGFEGMSDNLAGLPDLAVARANLAINQGVILSASQDLNLVTAAGTYYTVDATSTKLPLGAPTDWYFLEVELWRPRLQGDLKQTITALQSDQMFVRRSVGSTWQPRVAMSPTVLKSSLSSNVAMTTINALFNGPAVSQGTAGTWLVTGSITLLDSGSGTSIEYAKLWDGTTVIASGGAQFLVVTCAVAVRRHHQSGRQSSNRLYAGCYHDLFHAGQCNGLR